MNKVNICGIPHKIVEKEIIDGRSSYLGCPCFEDMDEAGEFVAWMPLPKAYESEADDD